MQNPSLIAICVLPSRNVNNQRRARKDPCSSTVLLFGCQKRGRWMRASAIYVKSPSDLMASRTRAAGAVVGYVNAFFATSEHRSDMNGIATGVMLLRSSRYRAEMVVWTELFDCADER